MVQVMHEGVSDDLLGDFSHISIAEGCFWLSVTNLVTIGYGSIVRLSLPSTFKLLRSLSLLFWTQSL